MLGLKFRREQVIEGFIADFYCPALGLVVEVDGSVHDDPEQAEYDIARSACFAAHGIRVARIRNEDVSLPNLEALLLPFLHPQKPPAPSASPSHHLPSLRLPLSIHGEGAGG
jgi:very-short-patch-repair endonuclease